MELPFYISYREFEKDYYDNLEKWFEHYDNTNEIDFLKSQAELYRPYLCYNFSEDKLQPDAVIKVKHCFFPYFENFGISFCVDFENGKQSKPLPPGINNISEWKTITMMEYAQHVLDKINTYFYKKGLNKEKENVLNYINNHEIITSKEQTGYCLHYEQHQKTIPFLKAFLPYYGCTVDISLYRNFHFSIVRIADFIDQKLKAVKAFEYSSYSVLRSEATIKLHMKNHNFLTICN
ncbi:hypothetical protein ACM39_17330 [Chryseobacterium sp. FH2]|uniref:hypothetical protein n=1 Tax=Chryseobacterium sp. FH2 TaxID=1674291 RepID=UPI00065AD9E7|nr:hypothetical protein [Chryseobacterium sp. FH2]KMQ62881.1 hypothetical protein ACM39_17330 [Chryseobacterium sp. FH2]